MDVDAVILDLDDTLILGSGTARSQDLDPVPRGKGGRRAANRRQRTVLPRGDANGNGALFRPYWLSALLASEQSESDGDLARVKLLGAELVLPMDDEHPLWSGALRIGL